MAAAHCVATHRLATLDEGDGALKHDGSGRLHFPWVPLGCMDALGGDQLAGGTGAR
jgi:hypothetical protein